MTIKIRIIFYTFLLFFLSSCSLFEINLCKQYITDNEYYRASSVAISSSSELAFEKALFLSKQSIAEQIDNYIVNKYTYKTFLSDPDYEAKITIARKTILNELNIVCSKTITKRDYYKSYVALEIKKENIDTFVRTTLSTSIK